MKISYITLKNFRQYSGEQTIHFATNDDRRVTIIHGVNGSGKTSLCIALNWCFYGNEFILDKFGQIGELSSKHHRARISGDGTSVSVGFTYQNEQYIATREFKNQGKTSFSLVKEGSPYPYKDAEDHIQLMIPKEVSVHFFFDGEKINNFSLPGNEKDIRDAVCNVLKIEVILRSITHLGSVRNEYNSELNKVRKKEPAGLFQTLLDKKESLEKEEEELVKSRTLNLKEITKAKEQIKGIDVELETNMASQKLAEDRKRIEEELNHFKGSKSHIEEQIRKLANQGFIPMAKPAIDKALEILDSIEVPNIPESVLQELLQQMRCICGRSIQHESQEHQNLNSLLAKTSITKSNTVIKETCDSLKIVSRTLLIDIPKDIKSALDDNQELDHKIASHNAELNRISAKLKNFKEVDVRRLQKTRDQWLTKIGELRKENSNIKTKIGNIHKHLDDIRKDIESAKDSVDKLERLSQYVVMTENAIKAMKKIEKIFAENMRKKVEPKVEQIFKQLVWKSSSFRNVRLSGEFELQVIDSFGEEAKPELSAGERQVLSLAFIMAMAEVAAEEMPLDMENEPYPIIMDTPFGKLSKEPIQNITSSLPDIAEQLILFVTDTELTDDARKNLNHRIGEEYYLQFDQEENITTITAKV